MKLIRLLFIGILFPLILEAQHTPKYSNEFLSIGAGARALGLSGAFVAAAADATSGYWNPAGLTGIKAKFQLALMHSEYFAGLAKYDFGSFSARLDQKSVLGITVIRFGVDDIPDTSELIDANGNINYDRIKSFSAIDNAFLISYSRQINNNFRLGGNLKIIYRKVGDFAKAWGFGLDAGAQYRKGKWQMGAVLRDASSTFNAWSFSLSETQRKAFISTNNIIPENTLERTAPSFIFGLAREFSVGKKIGILPELDFQTTFDGMRSTLIKDQQFSISPSLGLEINFNRMIFLRGGIGNFSSGTDPNGQERMVTYRPNLGLGLQFKGVSLDYALTNVGASALYSNVFSLNFEIGSLNPNNSERGDD